MTHLND